MCRNAIFTVLVVFTAVTAFVLAPTRLKPAPALVPTPGEHLLATPVAEFSSHGIAVEQAVELLSRKSGVAIRVDWNAFKEYRKEPCNLDLHDIRIDDAIAAIFTRNRINEHHWPPAVNCDASATAIVVTAQFPTPDSSVSTRLYDVHDLLGDEFWGPPPQTPGTNVAQQRVQMLADSVSSLPNWEFSGIQTSLNQSYTWNWIRGYGGYLIVIETDAGHQRVLQYLTVLRRRGSPVAGTTAPHR